MTFLLNAVLSFLSAADFLLTSLLSLVFGWIFAKSLKGIGFTVDIFLSVFLTLFASLSLLFFENISKTSGSLISSVLMLSVFGSLFLLLLFSMKSRLVSSQVLAYFFSILIGLFLGFHFTLYAFLLLILFCFLAYLTQYFYPPESRSKLYLLRIQLKQLDAIEKIDRALRTFDVQINEKRFHSSDSMLFYLQYETNPLTQHLLIKYLCRLKSIEAFNVV